jgi:hypothetical protein
MILSGTCWFFVDGEEEPDLSVISWARHIMKDESHGYANHEEETHRRFSGRGPRAAA